MAKRKNIKEETEYKCRDCKHAKDFHTKNWEGVFFMCRCKFSEHRSRFLKENSCVHFQHKHR